MTVFLWWGCDEEWGGRKGPLSGYQMLIPPCDREGGAGPGGALQGAWGGWAGRTQHRVAPAFPRSLGAWDPQDLLAPPHASVPSPHPSVPSPQGDRQEEVVRTPCQSGLVPHSPSPPALLPCLVSFQTPSATRRPVPGLLSTLEGPQSLQDEPPAHSALPHFHFRAPLP